MKYTIFTDTSANLPGTIIANYDIRLIPLSYHVDGTENVCLDPTAFDADAYYKKLQSKATVTTSLAPIQAFLTAFGEELEKGNDVFFIGMSSGISGTYQSAKNAADELSEQYPDRKIITIDTLAASFGEGLLVLKAARLREQGLPLEEAASVILKDVPKMNQVFTVADLAHLHRGGRISGVSALIGSVLHINPILKGNDEGKIIVAGKIRGRKKALEALAAEYRSNVVDAAEQTIGIAHCGCAEEAKLLADMISQIAKPKEIILENYEPVTGSHVGPGAIALFYMGSKR